MADNNKSAKDAIKAYLDNRAATDELFAASYAKQGKSLGECFRYIMGEARKLGASVCMTDEEVYGLAVHYYDEDNIKINPVHGRASMSPPGARVELTDEEKAAAREAAIKRYETLCMAEETKRETERRMAEAQQKKKCAEKRKQQQQVVPSLFDFDDL